MPKVIILRGNSASGKSTVVNEIVKTAKNKIAIIEHDLYRNKILFPKEHYKTDVREMAQNDVMFCLAHGYDVFWVSIFHAVDHKDFLVNFFEKIHPTNNYIFNFETTFEETLKRHETRNLKSVFGKESMQKWYKPIERLGFDFEYSIPQTNTLEETIRFIKTTSSI